jgi:hypothetical protein
MIATTEGKEGRTTPKNGASVYFFCISDAYFTTTCKHGPVLFTARSPAAAAYRVPNAGVRRRLAAPERDGPAIDDWRVVQTRQRKRDAKEHRKEAAEEEEEAAVKGDDDE